MDKYLELAEYAGNPDAGTAMEIAGQLRSEGWDASSALQEGWRQAKGESDNPVDSNSFEASPFTKLLLIAGLGTVIHRLITKQWWWEVIQLAQEKKKAIVEAQRIAQAKAQSNPSYIPSEFKSVIPLTPPVRDQWGRIVEEGISVIIP